MRVLYITYFGVQKHLIQTQVVPYLRELAKHACEITLMSFEERFSDAAAEKRERERLHALLKSYNIDWRPLRYHKRPSLPATIYDVAVGTLYGAYLMVRNRIQVLHARNHVPAVMALCLRALFGARLLFDLRGVMAEEYADAGTWKAGSLPFRLTKWTETRALLRADAVVMLTNKIRGVLSERLPQLQASSTHIEIIPCCVDTAKYAVPSREQARRDFKLDGKLVLAYAGSLGGWYRNEEMVQLFCELRRQAANAHFLIVTQSNPASVKTLLEKHRVAPSDYTFMTVMPDDMPRVLAAADLAISFITPCFSKQSSSPTKIGEYLAAGLPIIANRGIGDVDELLASEGAGVLVDEFNAANYERAVKEAIRLLQDAAGMRARCRAAAERRLSLNEVGVRGYLRAYEHLGLPANGQTAAVTGGSR